METTVLDRFIELGKIDYSVKGLKENRVMANIILKYFDKSMIDIHGDEIKGYYALSLSVYVWKFKSTEVLRRVLVLDDIKDFFADDEEFNYIYNIWKEYHLNDMEPCLKPQMDILDANNVHAYDDAVELLKSFGAYEIDGYKYGSGWLLKEIPADVVNELIEKYK